jgi:hypothetical protein
MNGLNGQLIDESLYEIDFWSDSQEEATVTDIAGDITLPDVVINDIPAGAVITRAIAIFKFRIVENTNAGANKLNGAQAIQIRDDSPSAWTDALSFVDDEFGIAATTREGGDAMVGDIDVSGTVIGDDTYNFQWHDGIADAANMQFNDVQVGLKIWYKI